MSSQLPHRHKCPRCDTLITMDCECSNKRVLAKLCDACYRVGKVELEDEEELEF